MNAILADIPSWFVVLILAVVMLSMWGAGWRLGTRLRLGDGREAGSKFDDASLALLGLLLAFTFGMSIAKHDHRREMVVADSNSIGDFYTCASLLKEPMRSKLQTTIRQYLELRVEFVQSRKNAAALEVAVQRSQLLQSQMTELVAQAVVDGTPIALSLTNTLNALISSHASRLAAARDRLPASILLLLFVTAVMSTMLVGREQGVVGRPEIGSTLVFILLVTLSVYVTLDLNQPQGGTIVVDQTPMQELLSTLNK